jgi:hypothetical protein
LAKRFAKAPNTKHQAPEKSQTPKPEPASEVRSTVSAILVGVGRFTCLETLVLELGIWSFFGAWNLELGASI